MESSAYSTAPDRVWLGDGFGKGKPFAFAAKGRPGGVSKFTPVRLSVASRWTPISIPCPPPTLTAG